MGIVPTTRWQLAEPHGADDRSGSFSASPHHGGDDGQVKQLVVQGKQLPL